MKILEAVLLSVLLSIAIGCKDNTGIQTNSPRSELCAIDTSSCFYFDAEMQVAIDEYFASTKLSIPVKFRKRDGKLCPLDSTKWCRAIILNNVYDGNSYAFIAYTENYGIKTYTDWNGIAPIMVNTPIGAEVWIYDGDADNYISGWEIVFICTKASVFH